MPLPSNTTFRVIVDLRDGSEPQWRGPRTPSVAHIRNLAARALEEVRNSTQVEIVSFKEGIEFARNQIGYWEAMLENYPEHKLEIDSSAMDSISDCYYLAMVGVTRHECVPRDKQRPVPAPLRYMEEQVVRSITLQCSGPGAFDEDYILALPENAEFLGVRFCRGELRIDVRCLVEQHDDTKFHITVVLGGTPFIDVGQHYIGTIQDALAQAPHHVFWMEVLAS